MLFAITLPGLENALAAEAEKLGFELGATVPGGVEIAGAWPEVIKANLELRTATRVLWRMGSFMAFHLAQLDKRAKRFDWGVWLRPDVPLKIEVTTSRKSKIYHAGAATKRIEDALIHNGFTISNDAPVTIKVRIEDNRVTLSLDTSGEPLHKRGTKPAVGKAPLRETIAAAFLHECGYDGSFSVYDPMCGSGTLILEAAEIATGLQAGRGRSFAFENLMGFDPAMLSDLRQHDRRSDPKQRFFGSDRDTGVIQMAQENAKRAGVDDLITFSHEQMADATVPSGYDPGLILVNPPYGVRIGNKKALFGVYAKFGEVMRTRFSGWRVGLITSEPALEKSTGLEFSKQSPPIAHGGLRIKLYQTDVLD